MRKTYQFLLLLFVSMFFYKNCLKAEIVKILIQGDTQKIMDSSNGKQDNFVPLMAKVLTDPITRDADFILQMGDIVETDKDNSDRPQQYGIAREGWRQLDGKIPYVLNLGNNDDAKEYFEAFDGLPEPFSKTLDGKNFAYKFSAGDVEWLIISIRFHRADEDKSDDINWAKGLIEANADKSVIFLKHEVNVNSGIVNQLKKYPNVVFVLSGHTQSQHEMLAGKNGNKIGWIRTCHHNARLDSYFRILQIDTASGIVSSSFYSPQYEKFWHDPTAPFHDCEKSAPWTETGFNFEVEETAVTIGENNARFISLEIPCCVVAGDEFKAAVVFENTGRTWDANLQQNKYKLGSENPRGNQDWGKGTQRTFVSSTVATRELCRFEIDCVAPVNEGLYNFQRRMLQESVQWFGESSENRIVYVATNKVLDSSFEDENAYSWTLGSGASIFPHVKKSGLSSLMLSGPSTATRQMVELLKRTNYEISFWVKSEMSETSGNVFFDIWDFSQGESVVQFKIKPGEATEWTQFTYRFNSRALNSATLRMFGNQLDGSVYFDDVVLKPCSPNLSFSSTLPVNAYKDHDYHSKIDISDFDDSSLGYTFHSKPDWLNFDSTKATLSGVPEEKDVGVHAVTLDVSSAGESEKIAFTVRVFDTSPYFFWNEEYQIGLETDDDDRDGLQNLLEFALGGNPAENDVIYKLPRLSSKGSSLDFTFRRNQSTVNYTIQKSANLIDWSDYVVIDDSHGLVGDTCSVPISLSDKKQFFKLEVKK